MSESLERKIYHKRLLPHQKAWLLAHPHRTEEWLRERSKDGFDIHHLDGDHDNNDPDNLVLIECADHMRIHNSAGNFLRIPTVRCVHSGTQKTRPLPDCAAPESSQKASYDLHRSGLGWMAVGRQLGVSRDVARGLARRHAKRAGLEWPTLPVNWQIPARGAL